MNTVITLDSNSDGKLVFKVVLFIAVHGVYGEIWVEFVYMYQYNYKSSYEVFLSYIITSREKHLSLTKTWKNEIHI